MSLATATKIGEQMNEQDLGILADLLEAYVTWQKGMAHMGALDPRMEMVFKDARECVLASLEMVENER